MTVLDTLNFVAFNPLQNNNPIAVLNDVISISQKPLLSFQREITCLFIDNTLVSLCYQ